MTKTTIRILVFCVILPVLLLTSCRFMNKPCGAVNAVDHGVLSCNDGAENSRNLQALIDSLSEKGGVIYIPSGEYSFAANGSQTIGSHCIKMRSGVSIIGDGESTVLKPVGMSQYGLDMFYFNDYLDTGEASYLENCRFEGFVIDASGTSCEVYTSAGKGFMFNLFKNCHWNNVTVKYTDATGFGIDCPIDSSIKNCVAIGCGKAATDESSGASGFGIGYGYSNDESIIISNCSSMGNKKFGFFFEHQGRFNEKMYSATPKDGFIVKNCLASDNLYNFGGICSKEVDYLSCTSDSAGKYGFYFENSANVSVSNCEVNNSASGVVIFNPDEKWFGGEISISDCDFIAVSDYDVRTEGRIAVLVLSDNHSELNLINIGEGADSVISKDNSWN